MIIKWAVSNWLNRPVLKEYERETAHFYVYNNGSRRDSKISSYEAFFDSEEAALEFIAERSAARACAKQVDQIKRHAVELLEALERLMNLDCPLTGNPSHERLVEFWEYEKSQGRGEADDQLFALSAIAKAKGLTK